MAIREVVKLKGIFVGDNLSRYIFLVLVFAL